MHLTHRQTCRVCGSRALTPVIDLGLQHLQGSFVKPGMEQPPGRRIPCEIVRCDPSQDENACGLLQMKHTVPPSILYSNYWYVSGTNQTMRDHLKGIALDAVRIASRSQMPEPRSRVLDIGCNDLTLLKEFPETWECIGIDPSNAVPDKGPGNIQVISDLFPSAKLGNRPYDVITSIAMFYDLEDPVAFCQGIQSLLKPTGFWIVEMAWMPQMLLNNSYDTICHEHLEYYSLCVLERIMHMAGLEIFRAELNDSNGGSIRCFVKHEQGQFKCSEHDALTMRHIREMEFDLELDTDKPYASFQSRIENHRDELMNLLRSIKRIGKSIHLYGASTKGNTLLQFCGIDSRLIDCAADRNPMKHGAMTLGTNIPIVSEEESRARNPDYYLVLPWHFRKEFLEREKGSPTRFIFPLPKVEIV